MYTMISLLYVRFRPHKNIVISYLSSLRGVFGYEWGRRRQQQHHAVYLFPLACNSSSAWLECIANGLFGGWARQGTSLHLTWTTIYMHRNVSLCVCTKTCIGRYNKKTRGPQTIVTGLPLELKAKGLLVEGRDTR